MKKYNRPVVEIKGFEVEDIMFISTGGMGGDPELQAVYKEFVGEGNTTSGEQAIVFDW